MEMQFLQMVQRGAQGGYESEWGRLVEKGVSRVETLLLIWSAGRQGRLVDNIVSLWMTRGCFLTLCFALLSNSSVYHLSFALVCTCNIYTHYTPHYTP